MAHRACLVLPPACNQAPTTARQAARIMVGGVRAGETRILVGEDAKVIDMVVRLLPKWSYKLPGFILIWIWCATPYPLPHPSRCPAAPRPPLSLVVMEEEQQPPPTMTGWANRARADCGTSCAGLPSAASRGLASTHCPASSPPWRQRLLGVLCDV